MQRGCTLNGEIQKVGERKHVIGQPYVSTVTTVNHYIGWDTWRKTEGELCHYLLRYIKC